MVISLYPEGWMTIHNIILNVRLWLSGSSLTSILSSQSLFVLKTPLGWLFYLKFVSLFSS